ncbi:hypothetical protein M9H77_20832 [Catharanthus roseus]|uniref:Uncharacterized protein n=1 Tax=Catharanthus roseus TaxID=4058 RepID=A0ACC0AL18_CATRO|nr:hypothetical protein M9H77_20832 [Catharanthus roseus]
MLFSRAAYVPTRLLLFVSSTSVSAVSMASLSSLLLPNPHHRPLRPATAAPPRLPLPIGTLNFSTKATKRQNNRSTKAIRQQGKPAAATTPSSSPPEKKSFAVATGELFLGIAARIISRGANRLIRDGEEGQNDNNGLMPGVTLLSDSDQQENWWSRKSKERIASVVEDPVQPEVIWEQRVKDVEAERDRKAVTSPGFSFSAAGLLFPYHLGVAQFLIEKGYIKETTPLAGASAGAIVCAVIASGADMHDALKATKILAEDCRLKGTAFRLGAVLREVLDEFLPVDIHIRSSGRVRVAVTQILWRPRGLLVDQYDSREDLINAVITSSFIPGYLAPRPATVFRNRICIDGGLTLFMPPTSAAQTIRVCAFPASRLGLQGIGISPDCNPENRASPRELFNWALEPAEDYILDKLFEYGYLDAAIWAEENPVEELVRDDSSLSPNGLVQ